MKTDSVFVFHSLYVLIIKFVFFGVFFWRCQFQFSPGSGWKWR